MLITIYKEHTWEIRRSGLLLLHELQSLLARDNINSTGLLPEAYTIALLCHVEHFRSEGSADELPVGRIRDRLEHLCNGCAVLGIQVGVNLIE